MINRFLQHFLIFTAIGSAASAQPGFVSGSVFLDNNANGIQDCDEPGIANIRVSNGREVTLTDSQGNYTLPVDGSTLIFPVKPAEYAYGSQSVPAFSLCRAGDEKCNFPLKRQKIRTQFTMLALGDPQIRGENPLRCFREDILDELLGQQADFGIVLGDVADNDLSVYEPYKILVGQLPFPLYHVFGNHDADRDAKDFVGSSRTFTRYLGPDYYSFDEGEVHFIVLNNVYYGLTNSQAEVREPYAGGLSEREFEWLVNDLKYVASEKLVVLLSHIPFVKEHCNKKHIERLFEILKGRKHLLAISGHLHETAHNSFGPESGWYGVSSFRNITVGATCGAWWTKPLDERGLPVATSMDGTPNGYFRFRFDGNRYSYHFVPANHREDFQMRIIWDGETLYANIFSASPDTRVSLEIGGYTVEMTHSVEPDPFIKKTLGLRSNFDDWTPRQKATSHLWKTALPANLPAGVYRATLHGTDSDGKQYTGHKLIILDRTHEAD